MLNLLKGQQKASESKNPIDLYNSLVSQCDSNFRLLERTVRSLQEMIPNGTVTLVAGAATVNEPRVTNKSIIIPVCQNTAGTPGAIRVSSRIEGQSFTINSSSALDTSLIGWIIIEP